jgi:hypothetical protein
MRVIFPAVLSRLTEVLNVSADAGEKNYLGALRNGAERFPAREKPPAPRAYSEAVSSIHYFSDKAGHNRSQFGHSGPLEAPNGPEFGQATRAGHSR